MRKPRRIYLMGGELPKDAREKMPSEVHGGVYWAHSATPPYWQEFRQTNQKWKSPKGYEYPVYAFTGRKCEKL